MNKRVSKESLIWFVLLGFGFCLCSYVDEGVREEIGYMILFISKCGLIYFFKEMRNFYIFWREMGKWVVEM